MAWLPGGNGHVLITSRERGWSEIAVPVEVDVLARPESMAILAASGSRPLSAPTRFRLAGELGDLPLAMAQAAGYMADTGTPAADTSSLLADPAGAARS